MAEGEEWLLRPVERGMCKLESLVDGTLDLVHIAMANEYLDVQEENSHRLRGALDTDG